jgi:hypothetical protein
MRRAGAVAIVMGFGLLVGGCAQSNGSGVPSGGPTSGIPPSPKTVTVASADHTALLHVGDHLVFNSSEPVPSGTQWTVIGFPKDQLTLDSKPDTLPFRFTAVRAGTGSLEVAVQPIPGASGTGSQGMRRVAITVTVDG